MSFKEGDRVIYGWSSPSTPYGWSGMRKYPMCGRVVGVEDDGTVLVHADGFYPNTPPYRRDASMLELDR